eukprot:1670224-Amphidinium_carterae.1
MPRSHICKHSKRRLQTIPDVELPCLCGSCNRALPSNWVELGPFSKVYIRQKDLLETVIVRITQKDVIGEEPFTNYILFRNFLSMSSLMCKFITAEQCQCPSCTRTVTSRRSGMAFHPT